VKEERQKLDEQIADVRAVLERARVTVKQKEDQRTKLTMRVADITGKLLAVRNEQLEASNRMQHTLARRSSHDSASQSASTTGSANRATSHDARAPLYASLVPKRRPGPLPLFGRDRASPRPLATFRHFKPIFYTDILNPNEPGVGGSIAAAEAFRIAQAAELGCHVDDVCWFAQMGAEVAPQVCCYTCCTTSCSITALYVHVVVCVIRRRDSQLNGPVSGSSTWSYVCAPYLYGWCIYLQRSMHNPSLIFENQGRAVVQQCQEEETGTL
jgi:hypothetical protein